jgi:hypothetical protein
MVWPIHKEEFEHGSPKDGATHGKEQVERPLRRDATPQAALFPRSHPHSKSRPDTADNHNRHECNEKKSLWR